MADDIGGLRTNFYQRRGRVKPYTLSKIKRANADHLQSLSLSVKSTSAQPRVEGFTSVRPVARGGLRGRRRMISGQKFSVW